MYATEPTAARAVASRHAAPASRGLPRLGRLLRSTADLVDPSGARPSQRVVVNGRTARPTF